MATFTTNKAYITQAFGENSGTWGTVLNDQMITYVDTNLGGLKNQSLSSSNVTLSAADSRNVIYRFTGVLTSNVIVSLDSTVSNGFCIVENLTTGNFTVSVKNTAVATAATIAQGTRALLISDNTNGVRIAAQTYTNLVNTFSAGSTGLTPSTGTTGDVTLAGTLNVANGGTGLTTLTANNVILGNGGSTPQFVAPSTSGNFLTSNGTTWVSQTYTSINYAVAQAASGTAVSFNNVIPSTAKKITVILAGVSATLSSNELSIQLGYGAGPTWQETGYVSQVFTDGASSSFGTGMVLTRTFDAPDFGYGSAQLTRLDPSSNYWVYSGNVLFASSNGAVSMPGVVTSLRVKFTGSSSFDAGTINISWQS